MQDTKLKYLFERYFQKLATVEELEEFLTIVEEPAKKKKLNKPWKIIGTKTLFL